MTTSNSVKLCSIDECDNTATRIDFDGDDVCEVHYTYSLIYKSLRDEKIHPQSIAKASLSIAQDVLDKLSWQPQPVQRAIEDINSAEKWLHT